MCYVRDVVWRLFKNVCFYLIGGKLRFILR